MNLGALLASLERLDVKLLRTCEGELELDFPESVTLPDHFLHALKEHKAALLTRVAVAESGPASPPPAECGWRACVADWAIKWRQRWADRAEARQVDGDHWNVAEWRAFLLTEQEITAAAANGEAIPFVYPSNGLNDVDAEAQIGDIDWDAPPVSGTIREAKAWNDQARTRRLPRDTITGND
jgi:hypothetical protein